MHAQVHVHVHPPPHARMHPHPHLPAHAHTHTDKAHPSACSSSCMDKRKCANACAFCTQARTHQRACRYL
eukprot:712080-Alexandrium_andersonii.AAC.1